MTFSASSGKGRGRPGQMEKWGPKRNCFRISDSVATQKGDGVMNRSSFAVAASFSIAASVAFGSMGYSVAYAVDGGGSNEVSAMQRMSMESGQIQIRINNPR